MKTIVDQGGLAPGALALLTGERGLPSFQCARDGAAGAVVVHRERGCPRYCAWVGCEVRYSHCSKPARCACCGAAGGINFDAKLRRESTSIEGMQLCFIFYFFVSSCHLDNSQGESSGGVGESHEWRGDCGAVLATSLTQQKGGLLGGHGSSGQIPICSAPANAAAPAAPATHADTFYAHISGMGALARTLRPANNPMLRSLCPLCACRHLLRPHQRHGCPGKGAAQRG